MSEGVIDEALEASKKVEKATFEMAAIAVFFFWPFYLGLIIEGPQNFFQQASTVAVEWYWPLTIAWWFVGLPALWKLFEHFIVGENDE